MRVKDMYVKGKCKGINSWYALLFNWVYPVLAINPNIRVWILFLKVTRICALNQLKSPFGGPFWNRAEQIPWEGVRGAETPCWARSRGPGLCRVGEPRYCLHAHGF